MNNNKTPMFSKDEIIEALEDQKFDGQNLLAIPIKTYLDLDDVVHKVEIWGDENKIIIKRLSNEQAVEIYSSAERIFQNKLETPFEKKVEWIEGRIKDKINAIESIIKIIEAS